MQVRVTESVSHLAMQALLPVQVVLAAQGRLADICSVCLAVTSPQGSAGLGDSPSDARVVAMQAVQAAQITFEDYFMADLAIEPLQIVGWEGIFGTFFMVAILLPIVSVTPGQDGSGFHEDTLETLHVRISLVVELPSIPCPDPSKAQGCSPRRCLRCWAQHRGTSSTSRELQSLSHTSFACLRGHRPRR